MNLGRGLKGSVNAFSGLVLLVLTAVGAIAYFTDSVSVSSFAALAFITTAAMLVFAYFGMTKARAAGLFTAVAVVLMVAVMWSSQPSVKSSQYQAVFLTNGQVYFGHLKDASSKTPTLTNVYYLQSTPNNPQTGGTATAQNAQTQLSLVKLGNELHGPEDSMAIKGDQILFWENLKDNGKVVQAIKTNQTKK